MFSTVTRCLVSVLTLSLAIASLTAAATPPEAAAATETRAIFTEQSLLGVSVTGQFEPNSWTVTPPLNEQFLRTTEGTYCVDLLFSVNGGYLASFDTTFTDEFTTTDGQKGMLLNFQVSSSSGSTTFKNTTPGYLYEFGPLPWSSPLTVCGRPGEAVNLDLRWRYSIYGARTSEGLIQYEGGQLTQPILFGNTQCDPTRAELVVANPEIANQFDVTLIAREKVSYLPKLKWQPVAYAAEVDAGIYPCYADTTEWIAIPVEAGAGAGFATMNDVTCQGKTCSVKFGGKSYNMLNRKQRKSIACTQVSGANIPAKVGVAPANSSPYLVKQANPPRQYWEWTQLKEDWSYADCFKMPKSTGKHKLQFKTTGYREGNSAYWRQWCNAFRCRWEKVDARAGRNTKKEITATFTAKPNSVTVKRNK